MLILVSGLPGSGKSTFSSALSTKLDCLHYNSDTMRRSMGLMGRYDTFSKLKVYQALVEQTQYGLKSSCVIVDSTFYLAAVRNSFYNLAFMEDVELFIFSITADETVIKERTSKIREDSEADFAVYKKIKSEFEIIKKGFLQLRSDKLTVDEMVAIASHYMHLR
ncbi:MAG: ATP-binding protein [Saprospiraceae bacterium]